MVPTAQQAQQQQMQQQILQQLQSNLTSDQRVSLNNYILQRQQAQPGANQGLLFQEWLKLNNLLPTNRPHQPQHPFQQQQQPQVQAQPQPQPPQARPPLPGGVAAQQAAQALIAHVFPAQLLANRQAVIQHLKNTLYRTNPQGGLATTPLLAQVVQLAKSKQLDSQQLDLLRQVLPNSGQLPGAAQSPQPGQSASPPPPFTQPNGLQQQHQVRPQQAAGTPSTPQQQHTPQTAQAQAQLLGTRIQQLDQLLKRTDLTQEQRDKATQQSDITKVGLAKVLAVLQAQNGSRQATPVPAQQPFQQQPAVSATPAGQHPRQPSSLGPGGALVAQAGQQATPLRAPTSAPFGQQLPTHPQPQPQQGGLAFGTGTPAQTMLGQTNGVPATPTPTTIAPSALQGSQAPTRTGTPAAMATTPGGANLSVGASTPAASGTVAATTGAAPAGPSSAASGPALASPRVSSDPRPDSEGRTVSKRKLRELLASIDDDDRLTDEAEDLLQDVADDFLNSITTFACQLAKHRKSERLEVKDIAFHLERTYGMKVPGFFAETETARPSQGPRRGNNLPAYQARLSAIQAGEGGAKRAAR